MNQYPKMLYRGKDDQTVVHDLAGENMAIADQWRPDRPAEKWDGGTPVAVKPEVPSNAGRTVTGKAGDEAPTTGSDRRTQPGQPHPPGGFKEPEPVPADDPLEAEKQQKAAAQLVEHAKDADGSKAAKARADAEAKAKADAKAHDEARAKAHAKAEADAKHKARR